MASEQKLRPLHLACTMDEMAPNRALIHIKNKIATAYNGEVLIKIDLSIDEYGSKLKQEELAALEGKYIHMNVWKEIHRCEFLEIDSDGITCGKDSVVRQFFYNNPLPEQLDAFSETPTQLQRAAEIAGECSKRIIMYNAHHIITVTSVFQCSLLNFSFSKEDKGNFVFPFSGCGMFAVIKPVPSAENRYFFN